MSKRGFILVHPANGSFYHNEMSEQDIPSELNLVTSWRDENRDIDCFKFRSDRYLPEIYEVPQCGEYLRIDWEEYRGIRDCIGGLNEQARTILNTIYDNAPEGTDIETIADALASNLIPKWAILRELKCMPK